MSLQYVIDGYNITHHRAFSQSHKNIKVPPQALAKFIGAKRLCGKNKAIIIFDGYPPAPEAIHASEQMEIVFSREQSADEKIKRIVERASNPRNVVVVSDDNEVRFFAKSARAKVVSVEEFVNPSSKAQRKKEVSPESELSFSEMEKINKELRNIWLK